MKAVASYIVELERLETRARWRGGLRDGDATGAADGNDGKKKGKEEWSQVSKGRTRPASNRRDSMRSGVNATCSGFSGVHRLEDFFIGKHISQLRKALTARLKTCPVGSHRVFPMPLPFRTVSAEAARRQRDPAGPKRWIVKQRAMHLASVLVAYFNFVELGCPKAAVAYQVPAVANAAQLQAGKNV